MRPIQPPRLKLRRARKGRRAIWVIKDREREISTGIGEGERGKAEIAFAEYLVKNRQPFFGDGRPNQVLIGDCLAVYCDKHGPKIARPDGLALEVERLAEFFGDRPASDVTEELCHAYVEWRCTQADKRATVNKGRRIKPATAKRELVTLSAAGTSVSTGRWSSSCRKLPNVVNDTLREPMLQHFYGPRSASTATARAIAFASTDTLPASF